VSCTSVRSSVCPVRFPKLKIAKTGNKIAVSGTVTDRKYVLTKYKIASLKQNTSHLGLSARVLFVSFQIYPLSKTLEIIVECKMVCAILTAYLRSDSQHRRSHQYVKLAHRRCGQCSA